MRSVNRVTMMGAVVGAPTCEPGDRTRIVVETEFANDVERHAVIFWLRLGAFVLANVKAGDPVYIEGRLTYEGMQAVVMGKEIIILNRETVQ